MKSTTFEDFLQDKHAAQYQGLDDEMGEDYEEWLSELDVDTWLEYGRAYSEAKALEAFNKYAEKQADFPWVPVPAKSTHLLTPEP